MNRVTGSVLDRNKSVSKYFKIYPGGEQSYPPLIGFANFYREWDIYINSKRWGPQLLKNWGFCWKLTKSINNLYLEKDILKLCHAAMISTVEQPTISSLLTGLEYRVSRKTLATFVFWISRLPRTLEILYWAFFNSPFCVDFRNVQFFIIRWNMEWDILKILQGGHFKTSHF